MKNTSAGRAVEAQGEAQAQEFVAPRRDPVRSRGKFVAPPAVLHRVQSFLLYRQ